jgi:hypothetical protein
LGVSFVDDNENEHKGKSGKSYDEDEADYDSVFGIGKKKYFC